MSTDQSMNTPLPLQAEIIQSLKNDGEQALARLFEQFRPRLKRIVNFRLDYRLNGRISESDVIQETFVRAAQRLDHYLDEEKLPFLVWLRLEITQKLHEIHRYHFGAEMRDVRKEMKIETGNRSSKTSMALAAHLVARMTSPSQLFERAEQIAKLEQTLNQMQYLDREVIALRHFEELTNIETAEALSIQPAAASKRYLRALKRLREIMQAAEEFDGSE